MKKKQALTLLEIMIVIFLIGLIGSVIGYNMKGSLEEGKAFKTERAMEQIYDILMLEVAQGHSPDEVVAHAEEFLAHSGIAKNPKKLLQDGWNHPFEMTVTGQNIMIHSTAYTNYKARKKAKLKGVSTKTDTAHNEDSSES